MTLVEEVDNGNMVGVLMVDLSAAFDMVDHNILLKKLVQFGLDSKAIARMESYLSGRSQSDLYSRTVSCTEPAPYCHGCWGTVYYVDDSTFSLAGTDPVVLSRAVSRHISPTLSVFPELSPRTNHRQANMMLLLRRKT